MQCIIASQYPYLFQSADKGHINQMDIVLHVLLTVGVVHIAMHQRGDVTMVVRVSMPEISV